jgi:hypothetical protein
VRHRPHRHHHNHLNSRIDIAERDYRSRFQPNFREEVRIETTVDGPKQEIVTDKMGYYDEDGNVDLTNGNSRKLIIFKVTTTPCATVSTVQLRR